MRYAAAPPPWDVGVSDSRNMLLPHLCYRTKFGHSTTYSTSIIVEICQKMLTTHVPPFKVTGTDTDRLATCDFLLVFYNNYGPISYRFRDRGQYLPNFLTRTFKAPAEGARLEIS